MHKIIVSPFPFLEIDKTKARPLIIISEDILGTCICGFITSHIPEIILETDILLEYSATLQDQTGLQKNSIIRLHKISTIDKASIVSEIGNLPQELESQLKTKLKKLFNL
jgi:mRNA interferase MazF